MTTARKSTRGSSVNTGNGERNGTPSSSVTSQQTQIQHANVENAIPAPMFNQVIHCFPCAVKAKTLALRKNADGAVVNAAVTWGPIGPGMVVPICADCIPTGGAQNLLVAKGDIKNG